MKVALFTLLLVGCVCWFAQAVPLNIHIVPHTHDDVGWLKTPDEYYYGANQSIQDAGVQYIIDTVITSLQQNPDRKFIYVEMAYFFRWWREQDNATQAIVKQLVASGQLEFINGGWTMHDEACVHFEDMVDQMTLGHQFLYNTFGIVPKIGWQLDPFGHSSTNAIIDYIAGFEALFFARMDYQDLATRVNDKGLEMTWLPSRSMPNISLLTGMMYGGYCSPNGFMFEYGDAPIQDDPLLEDYNLILRAEEFMKIANYQASLMRHNDIMLSWGCDFMYQNAHLMYKNIEKLMNYINSNSSYNANLFYSTPSIYAEAIKTANPVLPVKTDDFMPYADNAHSVWSGYFVSRSTLKGFVRYSSNVLHGITALLAASQLQSTTLYNQLFEVQAPNGVTTHHDAVTGTEKQHVADDYALNLNIANTVAFEMFSEIVGQIISPKGGPEFTWCPLLNESICPTTTSVSSGVIPLIVYNPLGWENTDYIRLPVNTTTVSIVDSSNNAVAAEVIPSYIAGEYLLTFPATAPAIGFSTYFVQIGTSSSSTEVAPTYTPSAPFSFNNRILTVDFDAQGNFKSVTNNQIGQTLQLEQQYLFYLPDVGDKISSQASGAYIFRPSIETPFPYSNNTNPTVTVVNGSTFQEVRRYWQADLSQVIRLYADQDYIEIEDIIGPIDISGKQGKEVITRYTTSFNTENLWYSDSNGIELLQRKTNYRPSWNYTVEEPVAGNYVPVNAITAINDTSSNLQLTVVVDRSRSSASLVSGQLETMLHRRLLVDDGRGVGEPLNESTIMASKEWLVFSNTTSAASIYRPLAKKAYHPFLLGFGPSTPVSTWTSQYKTSYAPLGITLPPNVQLLNFVPLPSGSYIVRLHHIFQEGEDDTLSQPVTVDITNILTGYNIVSVQETQLTAVAPVARPDAIHLEGHITEVPITLQPTEIRTFVVSFKASTSSSTPFKPPQSSIHIV